jgi:hypothetical protein
MLWFLRDRLLQLSRMTGDVVSIDALLAGIWDGVHGVGGAYDPARRMPPLPRFLLSRHPGIWINLMDGLVSEKSPSR